MTTRRNVLTFLGLAGVASAAVAGEDLTSPRCLGSADEINAGEGRVVAHLLDGDSYERIAVALERLAAGIRSKEVSIHGMAVDTEITTDDWLTQELSIKFELSDPPRTA